MGSVYEAEAADTGRRVALKVIVSHSAAPAEAVGRFRQEGRLAATLAHPRCVFVLAADEDAGRPYIVMELMPGDTLKDLVKRRGPLPPAEAVALALDVIDGLAAAHRRGIVHRDVKPSNCFLDGEGRVKVGDFGLAKSLTGEAALTVTGAFVGTPLFASPEQIKRQAVDERTDVYSAAATLYFLLTGRAPFETGDATATMARIVSEPAPSLREPRPELSAGLDRVVRRGLERDRALRWQGLAGLRAALLPFVPGRLAAAPLGRRFAALFIDWLTLLLPTAVLSFLVVLGPFTPASAAAVLGLGCLAGLLYFAVPEGRWGCTPGKAALGLRVWNATDDAPPGVPRAFLRALVCFGATYTAFVVVHVWQAGQFREGPTPEQYLWQMATLPVFALGVLLLLCTMRARNGYRCLHDLLTGTRVVRLPDPDRRPLPTPRARHELSPLPVGIPGRVGTFVIEGVVRDGGDRLVLRGVDESLSRPVVLWLRGESAPPLPAARREVSRGTRPRWLSGGFLQGRPWDAFVMPDGAPLAELVRTQGRLSWAATRPLLVEMADELAAARADGTLPALLAVDQVWLLPDGRVQLLDAPTGTDGAPSAPAGDEEKRALALLGAVATLCLEGTPRGPATFGGLIRAPLPLHVAGLLRPLVGAADPYPDVGRFRRELAATKSRPAETTRALRAVHLAILCAFLFVGMAWFVVSISGTQMANMSLCMNLADDVARREEALRRLDEGIEQDAPLVELLRPGQRLRAEWLERQLEQDRALRDRLAARLERDRAEYEARSARLDLYSRHALAVTQAMKASRGNVTIDDQGDVRWGAMYALEEWFNRDLIFWHLLKVRLLVVGFWPAVWLISACLARGGLSLRVAGLALVRGDGRPASRLRCLCRAALVWAPVAGLFLASTALDTYYWTYWQADDPLWWVGRTAAGLWYAGVALLPAYAALALLSPARGPHDQLAGTYVVPR
jgi:hypothetical protein